MSHATYDPDLYDALSKTEDVERAQLAALRGWADPDPALVAKLPKTTCQDCSKKQCNQHQRSKCNTCGAYITSAHIHLDYLGHADVTKVLGSIDPYWTWEPLAYDEHGLPRFDTDSSGLPIGLWIKLTVAGVTRLGYGSVDGNKADAEKELIGDALRNAAMRFGVGLSLWSKAEGQGGRDAAPARQKRQQQDRDAVPDLGRIEELIAKAQGIGMEGDWEKTRRYAAQGQGYADKAAEKLEAAIEEHQASGPALHGEGNAGPEPSSGDTPTPEPSGGEPSPSSPDIPQETWEQHAERLGIGVVPLLTALKDTLPKGVKAHNSKTLTAACEDAKVAARVHEVIDRLAEQKG